MKTINELLADQGYNHFQSCQQAYADVLSRVEDYKDKTFEILF